MHVPVTVVTVADDDVESIGCSCCSCRKVDFCRVEKQINNFRTMVVIVKNKIVAGILKGG
jgi:hypothetical protein